MVSAEEFAREELEGLSNHFDIDFDAMDEYTPLSILDAAEREMRQDTMKEVGVQITVPTHPIPSMQGAFAESMQEASENSTPTIPKTKPGNAAARRQLLLDQDTSEETHADRWRQKPGLKYHELWKLMAQISFGIYLLLNGIAKDDEQVMNILQGHVDEVDEFLEMTLEDFDLAQEDIDERLKFLKLPLENIAIFDGMLEDRQFRLQIVNGNERIEHVITRTASAMNAALKDVQQGLDACKEFTIYLAEEQEDPIWREERPDMEKVYDAMKGNVEGWYKAYVSLQTKGNHLGVALVQLGSIVAEMDRRAGEISRKTRFSTSSRSSPLASPPISPQPRHSRAMSQSMLKDLPEDPNMVTPAIQATLPAFQLVQDREPSPELESRRSPSPQPEHFILSPRTYTPVPSHPEPAPVVEKPLSPMQQPLPEIKKRSSLRKRFSLGKRKDNPADLAVKSPTKQPSEDSHWGPRQRVYSSAETQNRRDKNPKILENSRSVPSPLDRDASLNTPPSRGLDSAYCSDFEKPLSPPGPHPATIPSNLPSPPVLSRDFPVPSPRSDQQYFRPVQANPNSPLQRPWTAGPSNHVHTPSNLSNQSNLSTASRPGTHQSSRLQFSHNHTPSQLRLGEANRRAAPSAMGMSTMSDMTTVTENGKKVKKKRSAFGWLKKAFALDEEERMAFEKRRAGAEDRNGGDGWRDGYFEKNGERKWIDGRRVTRQLR